MVGDTGIGKDTNGTPGMADTAIRRPIRVSA